MYYTRKLSLNSQKILCNNLALESGKLYSQTVKFFWRTVRKKNLWLKPSSMMRLFNSHKMHAHSADASVQQFFHALKSWRKVRKTLPGANAPKRLKKYCSVIWKNSSIRVKDNQLFLSNGRNVEPLVIAWKYKLVPVLATLRWIDSGYELIFCYKEAAPERKWDIEVPVGVDTGQIHVAGCSEGTILNGRLLRSIRQGRERSCAVLAKTRSRKKKGSKRNKRIREAKRKLCKKVTNKTRDILHKYTTGLVMYLKNKGYNTLVIGDLRGYRIGNDCGSRRNQENHAWLYSQISWYLKYKWKRLGFKFVQQEESYTSQTCLSCGTRKKQRGREYMCKCCGFVWHRDLLGATNILRKYLGTFGLKSPVDAVMAPAKGVRYGSHVHVAHGFKHL